ncbi:SPOR domain-containing protein [Ponticoccus sp. SC2-23]|uniref:SPOR domain-containing protein n=1 Tax=Alexandriicola marinus TaxID=2081710 RepID=UPI000FD87F0B|nr:SPOR domain-containing protein [Alexandriicola marinus]MBM1219124.1 SPOR domain-containing protein [Ponticoccus sp. SC6-9]MBM1223804.1 SPOR domain-containing protein [Ponticoccus sp. SC6-15]MBM1228938.1 SPOR domain-containing protein [Ponticoccus sp. SC6-38]MBM1232770.1 SPOR domain-containing protein [Ponticoccus sp. SC6-45]MBM1237280.1 SPOR domain-containing protein [Ponticoccus sp. SC6-49]MBM1241781.1 SPOR domain-containing protein [Ponticoccus sp. SC2-64]MBM1246294.1 SPOR domain-contai
MAEVTQEPAYGSGATSGTAIGSRAGMAVQVTGAVMSLALLAGMGVWGYKLVMRDVNGIPVVRAMDGPMRQAPENPGGELALHTGLAVNEVAAQGEAAPPEETLVLAPATPDLTEEDLLVQPTAEAGEYLPEDLDLAGTAPIAEEPQPIILARPEDAVMSTEDILALADQIAAGAEPLTDLSSDPVVAETAPAENPLADAVSAAVAELVPEAPEPEPQDTELAVADVPDPGEGLARALRPPSRPAGLTSTSAATPAGEPAQASQSFAVSTDEIPEGTVLVQLGAFDSVDLAGGEWVDLADRFEDFMDGRDRLIQVATSGGRDFYRLRATGFADLDDARRFCSALVAEDAPCIPVVVR